MLPEAGWVLISVPGRYAAGVAREALRTGKHVFLYSDNVSLDDEIELKQSAAAQKLMVMGPDCGTAIIGGIVADALSARGYRDAKIRVGFFAAWLWLPFGIAFPLVDDGVLAMVLVAPAAFLASMPFGVAPAALQEMMPNNLRGQMSALYLFVINLIGLAIGPFVVALMTDYVFTEAAYGLGGIRWSLLSTTTFAHLGASVLLFFGMREYRAALTRLAPTDS